MSSSISPSRKRPGPVTAIAILNIVFGILWILLYLCLGLVLGFFYMVISGQGAQKDMQEIQAFFQIYMDSLSRNVPGFLAYMIASSIFGILMTILLLISGIGLLSLKKWARNLCIAYGVLSIVFALIACGYTIAFVNSGMPKVQEEINEWISQKAKNPQLRAQLKAQQGDSSMQMMMNSFGSVMGTIFAMIYPIAVLVIMFLPKVKLAFSGQDFSKPDDYDDTYDYERRPEEDEGRNY